MLPSTPTPAAFLFFQHRPAFLFIRTVGRTIFHFSVPHRPLRILFFQKQEHLDARLTDLGKQQCATLKAKKHGVEKEAELVVVSPLTRAIQTAMLTIDKARRVINCERFICVYCS